MVYSEFVPLSRVVLDESFHTLRDRCRFGADNHLGGIREGAGTHRERQGLQVAGGVQRSASEDPAGLRGRAEHASGDGGVAARIAGVVGLRVELPDATRIYRVQREDRKSWDWRVWAEPEQAVRVRDRHIGAAGKSGGEGGTAQRRHSGSDSGIYDA